MIETGLIRETEPAARISRPGQRFVTLDVNPTGGYLLGLSLRVFQQTVTLTDRKNQRFDQIELKSKHLADPDAVIRAVAAAMGTMVEKCRNREWSLAGGGIAITGAIEPNRVPAR